MTTADTRVRPDHSQSDGLDAPDGIAERLRDRERELGCLRDITALRAAHRGSTDRLLQAVVDRMALAWRSPERMHARIALEDRSFESNGFRTGGAVQSAPLAANGTDVGLVEIHFTGPADNIALEPFSIEERTLLESIALEVSLAVEQGRLNDRLSESENRYRMISELASDFVYSFRLDDDGLFRIEWRAGELDTRALFEMSGAFAVSCWADCVHPDDRPILEQRLARLRRGEWSTDELRVVASDGTVRWLLLRGRPEIAAESGRLLRIIGSATDMSDRKAAEFHQKAREDALKALQKIEAIRTLAGGTAHDFNNLLQPIILVLEDILEDQEANAPLKKRLTPPLTAALRARDLVRNLLEFSKTTSSSEGLLDIADALRDAVQVAEPILLPRVTVSASIPDSIGHVAMSAVELQQVIINLATNAIHPSCACSNFRLQLSLVSIDAMRSGQSFELQPGLYALLVVEDDGAGIPPDNLTRIFDPYFTTKPVNEGSGLGLSVVSGIVNRSGGAVFASSSLGHWSRFDLFVPIVRAVPNRHQEPGTA